MMHFNLLEHIRGKDNITVVWLFNIGVEKYWNEKKLSVKDTREDLVVNHIEEINLLITKKQDIMILRRQPDEGFLKELGKRGYEIPHIICPNEENEDLSVSELVLRDTTFKSRLYKIIEEQKQRIGQIEDVVFVPYGVSPLEENVAARLGLRIFGAPSEICRKINDKIFSRELALANNFKVPDAVVCRSIEEVEVQSRIFLDQYKKIIMKEPCGASGKGLWVVDSEDKLKSVLLVVKRFLRGIPDFRILVEEWCEKKGDLNYQIYIGENGETEVFSIKQQLLEETVYTGSLMPFDLSESLVQQCVRAGRIIGDELSKTGYVGIAGVDALWLEGDILVPVIEINARFTLSTYLSFQENGYKLAFYKKIKLTGNTNYGTVRETLRKNNLWCEKDGSGAFVYVSETINGRNMDNAGRLFCVISAHNKTELMQIYNKIQTLFD